MNNINFLDIFISMAAFIIAASIHEFSHGWAAYRLGDDTAKLSNRLTFNPLHHIDLFGTILLPLISAMTHVPVIGWMVPVPVNSNNFKNPSRDMAIVSFWGPYSNFIQALFGMTFLVFFQHILPASWQSNAAMGFITQFLTSYYMVNLVLMFFNLLPVPPLDGGWIIRAMLPYRWRAGFDRYYPYATLLMFVVILFSDFFSMIFSFLVGLILIPINALMNIHFTLILVPLSLSFIPLIVLTIKTTIHATRKHGAAKAKVKNVKEEAAKKVPELNENLSMAAIISKMKQELPLNSKEKELLSKLIVSFSKKDPIEESTLCDEVDFLPTDAYCQKCKYFHSCALRFLSSHPLEITENHLSAPIDKN